MKKVFLSIAVNDSRNMRDAKENQIFNEVSH